MPAPAASDILLYDDALRSGFEDWSWAPHAFDNSSPVYAGSRSISVTFAGNYDGLWLVRPGAGINTSGYESVRFAIHGGSTGGQMMSIKAGSGTNWPAIGTDLNIYLPGGPVAGTWRVLTIPLSAWGLQASTFNSLAFQSNSGGAQSTFYLDDIRLVAAPPPPGGISGTVRIQATGVVTPLDSRLLGTNLPAWLGPGRLLDPTLRARTGAAGVTVLRLPGGSWSNTYDWLGCEIRDANRCEDWKARPTDFLNFLRATNRPALWVVNPNGTTKEAAALVAFFNAPVTDATMIGTDLRGTDWYTAGHWATLRSDHGNPAPYPVKLWEVGNEVYGGMPKYGGSKCASYGWEEVWTCDGGEYVNGKGVGSTRNEGYLEFRQAMRSVDPNVWVGAVGVPDPSSWTNWGNDVISGAGGAMDFYSIHEYAYNTPPPNNETALAEPEATWGPIQTGLRSAFGNYAGGRAIPVGVTEYNLFSSQDQDGGQLMTRAVNALHIADTLGQMALHGMTLANQWDLANGAASNGTDYGLLNADTFARSPQYYVFPLWARFGSHLVPLTSTLNAADALSVYAGRAGPRTVTVLAINKTGGPITTTLDLPGMPRVIGGTVDEVRATSLDATNVTFNGIANPADDLSNAPPAAFPARGNPVRFTFRPYSVTLLRLEVEPMVYLPFLLRGGD